MSKMLPSWCHVPIDKSEAHANYCFDYDKIMSDMFYLHLSYLMQERENVRNIIRDIANKAVNYGLISEDEKEAVSSIEDACLVAYIAKDQII